MGASNKFVPTIGEIDPSIVPEKVTKVIFCNGKIYYDLLKNREDKYATFFFFGPQLIGLSFYLFVTLFPNLN